jgi:hypothetical protein
MIIWLRPKPVVTTIHALSEYRQPVTAIRITPSSSDTDGSLIVHAQRKSKNRTVYGVVNCP